jgi:hypothetical protein
MIDPAQSLSNPVLAVALRVILASYVIYFARKFYANPVSYLRSSARSMPELPLVLRIVRSLAVFCLWGGCFILATVVAVQFFGLHGELLAVALVTLAAIAAWFLLPRDSGATATGSFDSEDANRLK